MRARQAEPTLVKPGEPDEYGTSVHREPVLVLSHRAPLEGEGIASNVEPSSGLVNAVEPLIRACSGVWVAHGVDADEGATARQPYRVRQLSFEDDEQRGFYYGFANEALWPMCHRAHIKPVFRLERERALRRRGVRRSRGRLADRLRPRLPLRARATADP